MISKMKLVKHKVMIDVRDELQDVSHGYTFYSTNIWQDVLMDIWVKVEQTMNLNLTYGGEEDSLFGWIGNVT